MEGGSIPACGEQVSRCYSRSKGRETQSVLDGCLRVTVGAREERLWLKLKKGVEGQGETQRNFICNHSQIKSKEHIKRTLFIC